MRRRDALMLVVTAVAGLSIDQTRAVTDLNLKYATKMEPVIKGSEGPFVRMRQMREINAEKETELKGGRQ